MIRVVPTGDLGLDVLLGGGWRLIKRFEDKQSATVIVRGGSGAGKTLLGIQAAIELARDLGGDVAVGCVEILPAEYVAQLQSARPSLAADRIARLPARAVSDEGPRVYVGLLQLEGDEPDLVTALENLDARVREAGGNPTAFIVDSLIEGYGLGASRARIEVDDILKFAVRYGRGLVLCEETPTDAPSPWVFAADTVLQLGVESRDRGRWIEVKKHRFGPSATGRHELDLVASGSPSIYAGVHAWQLPWVPEILTRFWSPPTERRPPTPLKWNGSPDLPAALWLVASADEHLARHYAETLAPLAVESPRSEAALNIRFDPLPVGGAIWLREDSCGGYVALAEGEARGLRHMLQLFNVAQTVSIDRVVIGDFGQALTIEGTSKWIEVLRTFAGLVTESGFGVPVIAYETSPRNSSGRTRATDDLAAAADIVVTIDAEPERAMTAHPVHAEILDRWRNASLSLGLPKQFARVDLSPRPTGRE